MKLLRAFLLFLVAVQLQASQAQELVTIPGDSPLIDIKIQFDSGAVDDPQGKEGLASLTAHSLSEGSTQSRSYQDLLKLFYPWSVSLNTTVGKEMVTYSTTVHKDHLQTFTPLLVEMLTAPKFQQQDLDRLRDKAKNYLTQDLRGNNDEELGKEAMYLQIYPSTHPYGHHNSGTVSGLDAAALEDLKSFYAKHFQKNRLILGVAGGYPEGYPEALLGQLAAKLPSNEKVTVDRPRIDRPAAPDGRRVTIVEKDTRSVAISIGFPIEVNRSHPDWAALYLFSSFLGEHRSSNSYLYQKLREARGLNYGDYAYVEYFPNGMYLTQPEPNYPRSEQVFQIWIRPVQPETALFTLRATLYELDKILREGLSREQFEATRSYLKKYAPLLVASSSRNLGYVLDSKFYETDPFVERLRRDLDSLSLETFNETLRKHIQSENLEIVMVAKGAVQLRQDLLDGKPSPMTYNSEKPESVLQEDRVIQRYPLELGEITIVPVSTLFR